MGRSTNEADTVDSTLDAIAGQPHVVAVTNPLETEGTVSPDGTIGYAQVAYDEPAVDLGIEPFDALQGTLDEVRSPDLEVEIGGEYASWGTQPETTSSELIGLLAAMIILLIAFGSVVAMGLPIGTAVIGLTTGTGLTLILASFASVPEFATILSSMIGLGVGIDYALFIVTRYRQNLQDGMEPLHAIGLASATAGQAVVFSGIMVSIALLGLWISGIAFVGMMATAAAIVVLVAVVAAITLLPALLGFAGNAIDKLSIHRRHEPTAAGGQGEHVVPVGPRGGAAPLAVLRERGPGAGGPGPAAVLDEARVPRRRDGTDVGNPATGVRPVVRRVRTGVQRPAAAGGRDR